MSRRGALPVWEGGPGCAGGPETTPRAEGRTARLHALHDRLRRETSEGALVAFSGGVDSAFLLWASTRAASEVGGEVVALTGVSASVPRADLDDAARFVRQLGIEHLRVPTRELSSEAYARNDRHRCYHCRVELFDLARAVAGERALARILYGYTASDRDDVRPGHRAALERGVLAPLADAGVTKADIRATMREEGFRLSEKPASPCLSSRLMTGVRVTAERLEQVEALEGILRAGGVQVCRVRVCEGSAGAFLRIEAEPADMARIVALRGELLERARAFGYRWVTLDLEGYRTGGGTL